MLVKPAIQKAETLLLVGTPVNFRGLIYAPVNENGVIFIFSKVAELWQKAYDETEEGDEEIDYL